MILTAWLLHSIRLAAALGTALLLMQAPAETTPERLKELHAQHHPRG